MSRISVPPMIVNYFNTVFRFLYCYSALVCQLFIPRPHYRGGRINRFLSLYTLSPFSSWETSHREVTCDLSNNLTYWPLPGSVPRLPYLESVALTRIAINHGVYKPTNERKRFWKFSSRENQGFLLLTDRPDCLTEWMNEWMTNGIHCTALHLRLKGLLSSIKTRNSLG